MVFIQFHQSIIPCQFYTLKPNFLSNYWKPITQIQCSWKNATTQQLIQYPQHKHQLTYNSIQNSQRYSSIIQLLLKLFQNLTLTYDQIDPNNVPNHALSSITR